MNPLEPNSKRSWSALLTLATLAAIWAPSSQSAASYPTTFPWRGDALDPNVHFRAQGHMGDDYGNATWAIDFHAAKWESGDWQRTDGGGQNTDSYIFGVPVYSPIDGEIVACWRTAPDKPTPSLDYDFDGDGQYGEGRKCVVSGNDCTKDSDCFAIFPLQDSCGESHDGSPMAGGNHVQIRNEAGDFILYFAHLQANSIPPELCPLPADRDEDDQTSVPNQVLVGQGPDGWPDDLTKPCGGDGFPQGTILPTPVAVKAGQFIGRVGHSGASSGPHLHMHAVPLTVSNGQFCMDDSHELLFSEAWSQECHTSALAGSWSPLDSENPLEPFDIGAACVDVTDCQSGEVCSGGNCVVEKPFHCFMPDAIGTQEDHDDYSVAATNLGFTTHADGDVLVYQSGGALRLRSYDLSAFGSIVPQDTHDEGAVKDVAAARPNSSRDVIVSVVGSNDNLKHIPYDVNTSTGEIVRMVGKEVTESDVKMVESTTSPAHPGFVVAVKDDNNDLKVIDYHVNSFLDIDRDLAGDGTGGEILDLAITSMSDYDGVVTAEVSAAGYLVVRSFDVPAAGGVTNADVWITIVDATSVTIDTVPTLFGGEYVVTSAIRDGGELRLDSWDVDEYGTVDWLDGYDTGDVSEHDGTAGSTIAGDFVMAVNDSDDNFRMMGWEVTWLGQLRRNSTFVHTEVNQTAIATTLAGGGDYLVAARTDAQDELHLYVYGENYHGWF